MHRFFWEQASSAKPGDSPELSRAEETHLFKILRAGKGDRVELIDGNGTAAEAEVVSKGILTVLSVRHFAPPEKRIHLYFAPPRKQKLDVMLKQAVELGAARLIPVITERAVALPDENSVDGRWQDLLMEACKQSGNPFLPRTEHPLKFRDALADALQKNIVPVYGSPYEDGNLDSLARVTDCGYFVGPEGGFSPEEESMLKDANAVPFRIGNWILRAETAVTAGLAVLQRALLR